MKMALCMSYSRRAELYEIEYDEGRDLDLDFDFVTSLVAQSAGRVLEMPCGAGVFRAGLRARQVA
jgi:hypothetical protein